MGSIEVTILGQKYTVRGDESEDYMKKLAVFVDNELRKVYNSAPNITPLKAAILASLNIADELQKLKEAQDSITRNIEEKANTLAELFD